MRRLHITPTAVLYNALRDCLPMLEDYAYRDIPLPTYKVALSFGLDD